MSALARKCWVLGSKGFVQNLQYLPSHIINTFASAFFGLIYISLWRAVTPPVGFRGYTPNTMVSYICFNQIILWLTQFGIRTQRRIRDAVRSGAIASEMTRPISFFIYRMSQDFGSQLYSLAFRGLPVGLILYWFGFHFSHTPQAWALALLSALLGCYIQICLMYLVGVLSFWTVEVRAGYWVVTTLSYALGGASMPLEVLPPWLDKIARLSPFPSTAYFPARIFLEMSGWELILPGLVWCVTLTAVCQLATYLARRKLEVQGG